MKLFFSFFIPPSSFSISFVWLPSNCLLLLLFWLVVSFGQVAYNWKPCVKVTNTRGIVLATWEHVGVFTYSLTFSFFLSFFLLLPNPFFSFFLYFSPLLFSFFRSFQFVFSVYFWVFLPFQLALLPVFSRYHTMVFVFLVVSYIWFPLLLFLSCIFLLHIYIFWYFFRFVEEITKHKKQQRRMRRNHTIFVSGWWSLNGCCFFFFFFIVLFISCSLRRWKKSVR